jgi:hypothetical protein
MRRYRILSLYLSLYCSILGYDVVQICVSVLHSTNILLLPANQPSLCQNPEDQITYIHC